MRPLSDVEFENFREYVNCNFVKCAHGMGLVGHGICAAGGKWNIKNCPEFITSADFLAEWEKRK